MNKHLIVLFLNVSLFLSPALSSAQQPPKTLYLLGVSVQDMVPELAASSGMKVAQGVYVYEVQPQSPAEANGIKPKDAIIMVDSTVVNSSLQFQELIASSSGKVTLTMIRAGKTLKLPVTLKALGEQDYLDAAKPTASASETPFEIWFPKVAAPGSQIPIDNFNQFTVDISLAGVLNVQVRAGGTFDLQVEYTVNDSLEQVGALVPVTLTYAIVKNGETFLEKKAELQATNGKKNEATKRNISAGQDSGLYAIRVTVAYKNKAETITTLLMITP